MADLSLRQLRYFAVLGRELNYRRAAEMLYVSQPALSLAIKQLETDIGVRLFIRDTRSVSLTDAGRMWLPKVEAALETVGRLADDVGEWARGRAGVLRIGYLVGIGTQLLADILRRVEQRYPRMVFEAIEFDFSDPTAGLGSGKADVALIRPPVELPGHDLLELDEEHWVACLPRDHRFAARASLTIAELLDEPIIAAPASAGAWRDYWIAASARAGRPATIAGEAATYESEFTAVSRGLGISFTASGASRDYQRPGIVFVPIEGMPPAHVALAWNRRSPSPQVLRFVDETRALIEESNKPTLSIERKA